MAFDRMAGNHRFGFSDGVCVKCGMTREYFEDHGKPACTGQKPEKREPLPIENDD